MSKIQDAFPAIGRELFEHEKPVVAAFREKYKSALEIIRESQPADSKLVFHDHSRAPFSYEQPVIDAAKEALESVGGWSQAPYNPPGITGTLKVRHVVPAWPYKQFDSLIERVTEVEQWMHKITWVANDLQVNVHPELFEKIYLHEEAKQMFTYFAGASLPKRVDLAPGKRWIKISRTLFVEENNDGTT